VILKFVLMARGLERKLFIPDEAVIAVQCMMI
jgi:hypothetical protein